MPDNPSALQSHSQLNEDLMIQDVMYVNENPSYTPKRGRDLHTNMPTPMRLASIDKLQNQQHNNRR